MSVKVAEKKAYLRDRGRQRKSQRGRLRMEEGQWGGVGALGGGFTNRWWIDTCRGVHPVHPVPRRKQQERDVVLRGENGIENPSCTARLGHWE